MALNDVIQLLVTSRFIDLFVPFVLIFSIMYAALLMSGGIFGGKMNNQIKVLISASISLIAISQHIVSPGSRYDIVEVMLQVLPNIGLLFVGALSVLMLMGFIGGERVGSGLAYYFTIAIIIFVIYLFLVSIDAIPILSGVDSSTVSALLALFVFYLLVSYMTGGEKVKTPEARKVRHEEVIVMSKPGP